MIRIGILGDIGSGKTYVAKSFGYPVFNADQEVAKLYKTNKNCFRKLKKILPKYIHTFPVDKLEIMNAMIKNHINIKKIIKIVHPIIQKKLLLFLKRHKNKKLVILDIPLLLENKINKKNDILVFVKAKRREIYKRIKKRENFDLKLFKRFKKIQLSLEFKKKKSHFIIDNNFTQKSVKKDINDIISKIYK